MKAFLGKGKGLTFIVVSTIIVSAAFQNCAKMNFSEISGVSTLSSTVNTNMCSSDNLFKVKLSQNIFTTVTTDGVKSTKALCVDKFGLSSHATVGPVCTNGPVVSAIADTVLEYKNCNEFTICGQKPNARVEDGNDFIFTFQNLPVACVATLEIYKDSQKTNLVGTQHFEAPIPSCNFCNNTQTYYCGSPAQYCADPVPSLCNYNANKQFSSIAEILAPCGSGSEVSSQVVLDSATGVFHWACKGTEPEISCSAKLAQSKCSVDFNKNHVVVGESDTFTISVSGPLLPLNQQSPQISCLDVNGQTVPANRPDPSINSWLLSNLNANTRCSAKVKNQLNQDVDCLDGSVIVGNSAYDGICGDQSAVNSKTELTGSGRKLCIQGTASSINDDSVTKKYTWSCLGSTSPVGKNVQCSAGLNAPSCKIDFNKTSLNSGESVGVDFSFDGGYDSSSKYSLSCTNNYSSSDFQNISSAQHLDINNVTGVSNLRCDLSVAGLLGTSSNCSTQTIPVQNIISTYTISGAFINGANAQISGCGTTVTANSNGEFSFTNIIKGTNCSQISAVGTGYSCSSITSGPSSVSQNVSNLTGSCILNTAPTSTYTVSGTFGVNGNGAQVSGCGTTVAANSNGDFSFTNVNKGANCSQISAVRSGYSCQPITSGPSSVSQNVSNLIGSCAATTNTPVPTTTYTVSGTFGTNGANALVTGCGLGISQAVSANSTGYFVISGIPSGTNCNNITANLAGFNCATTTNGPSALLQNFSGVLGNCSLLTNTPKGPVTQTNYYSITGNFGLKASGGTVRACGKASAATVNTNGTFTISNIAAGTNCSDVVVTATNGNQCTTVVNGPGYLQSNSSVSGNCHIFEVIGTLGGSLTSYNAKVQMDFNQTDIYKNVHLFLFAVKSSNNVQTAHSGWCYSGGAWQLIDTNGNGVIDFSEIAKCSLKGVTTPAKELNGNQYATLYDVTNLDIAALGSLTLLAGYGIGDTAEAATNEVLTYTTAINPFGRYIGFGTTPNGQSNNISIVGPNGGSTGPLNAYNLDAYVTVRTESYGLPGYFFAYATSPDGTQGWYGTLNTSTNAITWNSLPGGVSNIQNYPFVSAQDGLRNKTFTIAKNADFSNLGGFKVAFGYGAGTTPQQAYADLIKNSLYGTYTLASQTGTTVVRTSDFALSGSITGTSMANASLSINVTVATSDIKETGAYFFLARHPTNTSEWYCWNGNTRTWSRCSTDGTGVTSINGTVTYLDSDQSRSTPFTATYVGDFIPYGGFIGYVGYGVGKTVVEAWTEMLAYKSNNYIGRWSQIQTIPYSPMVLRVSGPSGGSFGSSIKSVNIYAYIQPEFLPDPTQQFYGQQGYRFILASHKGKMFFRRNSSSAPFMEYNPTTNNFTGTSFEGQSVTLKYFEQSVYTGDATGFAGAEVYVGYGIGSTEDAAAKWGLANGKISQKVTLPLAAATIKSISLSETGQPLTDTSIPYGGSATLRFNVADAKSATAQCLNAGTWTDYATFDLTSNISEEVSKDFPGIGANLTCRLHITSMDNSVIDSQNLNVTVSGAPSCTIIYDSSTNQSWASVTNCPSNTAKVVGNGQTYTVQNLQKFTGNFSTYSCTCAP
ncbi:MAG: hypothetical protein ACXVCN_12325 [Bdellovibrio sp.]